VVGITGARKVMFVAHHAPHLKRTTVNKEQVGHATARMVRAGLNCARSHKNYTLIQKPEKEDKTSLFRAFTFMATQCAFL
jgi:hypothetical protein